MKKIDELMQELGFDKEGSDDVKKAFIKNLIKTANYRENGADILPIVENKEPVKAGSHISIPKKSKKKIGNSEQLSFVFDDDKKLA